MKLNDTSKLRKVAELLQTREFSLVDLAIATEIKHRDLKILLLNLRYLQSLSRVCMKRVTGVEYWTTEQLEGSIPEELKDLRLQTKKLFEKIKRLEEENDKYKNIPNDNSGQSGEAVEVGTEPEQHGVLNTTEQGQPKLSDGGDSPSTEERKDLPSVI